MWAQYEFVAPLGLTTRVMTVPAAGGASTAAHAHKAYNVAETKQLKLKRILIAICLLHFNDWILDGGTGWLNQRSRTIMTSQWRI